MARRELLRVRLSRREIAALDRLAQARGGLTRSELVRRLIVEAEPSPPPPPSLDELLASLTPPPTPKGAWAPDA
jgi:Ribbon-helix-helix protein, copG family